MYDIPGDTVCQGPRQHGGPGEPGVAGQAAGYAAKRGESGMEPETESKPR